jgi:magnesium chelatase family protein
MAGELSLDGAVKGVGGILAMASEAVSRGKMVIIPRENEKEASLIKGGKIYSASSLTEVMDFVNKKGKLPEVRRFDISELNNEGSPDSGLDFADIHGMVSAKRAMTIAAAGGHGIFMLGSPASGKTMLAERLPSILPEMDQEEITEVTSVYSAAGLLNEKDPFIRRRPFRKPHSSITRAALIGGGSYPVPGEISLAHKGVLFMDEFAEFDRSVIDSLRTPLERKMIRINRRGESCDFPADFLFFAASNPCPCGYYGDKRHKCKCSQVQIEKYRSRISGPIMDRIDICLSMRSTLYEELTSSSRISSSEMKEDVEKAREVQYRRYGGRLLNSSVSDRAAEEFIRQGSSPERLLESAYSRMGLDPRTLGKVRRIARTIADIDGLAEVTDECVLEAIQYRFGKR